MNITVSKVFTGHQKIPFNMKRKRKFKKIADEWAL